MFGKCPFVVCQQFTIFANILSYQVSHYTASVIIVVQKYIQRHGLRDKT